MLSIKFLSIISLLFLTVFFHMKIFKHYHFHGRQSMFTFLHKLKVPISSHEIILKQIVIIQNERKEKKKISWCTTIYCSGSTSNSNQCFIPYQSPFSPTCISVKSTKLHQIANTWIFPNLEHIVTQP